MIRLSIFGVKFITYTVPEIMVKPFPLPLDRDTEDQRAIIIANFNGKDSRCFYGTFRFSDPANVILEQFKLIRDIALVLQ